MSRIIQTKNSQMSKELALLNLRLRSDTNSTYKLKKKLTSARSAVSIDSNTEPTDEDLLVYRRKNSEAARRLKELKTKK